MKMNVEALADLVIHSFLRGVEHAESLDIHKEGISEEDSLEEYFRLFIPIDDKDGDWDYNDQT